MVPLESSERSRLASLAKHNVASARKDWQSEGGQYELADGDSYGNRDAMRYSATARRNLDDLDDDAPLRCRSGG